MTLAAERSSNSVSKLCGWRRFGRSAATTMASPRETAVESGASVPTRYALPANGFGVARNTATSCSRSSSTTSAFSICGGASTRCTRMCGSPPLRKECSTCAAVIRRPVAIDEKCVPVKSILIAVRGRIFVQGIDDRTNRGRHGLIDGLCRCVGTPPGRRSQNLQPRVQPRNTPTRYKRLRVRDSNFSTVKSVMTCKPRTWRSSIVGEKALPQTVVPRVSFSCWLRSLAPEQRAYSTRSFACFASEMN